MLFISSMLAFAACKKSGPSVSSELIGNWTMIRYAYDLNGNGIPDGNEWYTLASISSKGNLTIRSNNTGYKYKLTGIRVDSFSFYWTVNNNYLLLNEIDGSQLSLRMDTVNYHSLVVKDTSNGNTNWVSMVK